MKIYISPSTSNTDYRAFLSQLSFIEAPSSQTTPVVVVDETHGLSDSLKDNRLVESTIYHLDDFICDTDSVIDRSKIVSKVGGLSTEWLAIDMGHVDRPACNELFKEFAKYNFITSVFHNKNIVFFVPRLFLTTYARILNEQINNLPCSITDANRESQVDMLFLSARVETVFISYPILFTPWKKLYRLALFFIRRLTRAI